MESIKQIKVDLSNKREETRNLCGKTPRWGNITWKQGLLILHITLPITIARAHTCMEFKWDPYNSQAYG
jgi:hypothetical protein